MINGNNLLNDLKLVLRKLEEDMRSRCDEFEAIDSGLKAEHQNAVKAERTAETYRGWRDDLITQSSVAWILGCVFIRFMEDNGLVENVGISGVGENLALARDNHTLYFREHPRESDREYLECVFRGVSNLPAIDELFGIKHNPLWRLAPTGDGAAMLLGFFQKIDSTTGSLIHDFTDENWDTRFLGDLYQDLSEAARKKYALLQTPDFVESFILDRTLTPAIDTFGLAEVRMIDPTCGSGHFILGGFHRLLKLWQEREPETNERELAARALNAVYGVDLNSYAVAIARFRLLVAALKASGIRKMKDAPDFKIHLAVGDSLLHGPRPGVHLGTEGYFEGFDPIGYVYESEDAEKLKTILGQQYHAVVGNPPYITVKDKTLNKKYRERFRSCYRQFSLVCPFVEWFFDLAITSQDSDDTAGYIGLIAANSFMKREFGKRLVEKHMPQWDLTHVVDTSGVYIPGHGTPTVILLGRNQTPVEDEIRTVMGIKGEPETPEKPSEGIVWSAILNQIDQAGSESEFVSVDDVERKQFHKHPWSIGGGGATTLKIYIESNCNERLKKSIKEIGRTTHTGEDDVYYLDKYSTIGQRFLKYSIPLIIGENIRDYKISDSLKSIFPYDLVSGKILTNLHSIVSRHFWIYRKTLKNRMDFGEYIEERGLLWYAHSMFFPNRYKGNFSIAFAFIATHNHFVLDRGGKIFKQTAPVIKLQYDASVNQHLELIGLLNSSTVLFWARQTFFPRGGFSSGKWEERLEWDGTKLKQFPISDQKPLKLSKRLDTLGQQLGTFLPSSLINQHLPTKKTLKEARTQHAQIRQQMITLQEELDWQCYNFYKITDRKLWMPNTDDVPPINLGERAFEIVMARKMQTGELETAWFERHGSIPITKIPSRWPDEYRRLVQERIDLMENNKNIRLIEQPEYKRRWAMEPWDKQIKAALNQWLLNRLEYALCGRDLMAEEEPKPATKQPKLISCAQLADLLRADKDFLQVAELYKGRPDFPIVKLVETLVGKESVPFLPSLRYKPSGLRKRKDWEHTWDLQRKEDILDARTKLRKDHPDYLPLKEAEKMKTKEIDPLPVPPKYQSKDFVKASCWKLRGKLDVPKERFISYPGCERDTDKTLVITWAGWDHLQQAQALAAYLEKAKDSGWSPERCLPILAGLQELVPWLKQWHNDLDPTYGAGMGDFFADYVVEEARLLGKTVEDLKELKA